MSERMAGFDEQFLMGHEAGTVDTKKEVLRLLEEMEQVNIFEMIKKRCSAPAFLKHVPEAEREDALQIIGEIIEDILTLVADRLDKYIDPDDPGAE